MESMQTLTPFLGQLAFPEAPRWHEGALWFSDFYTHSVKRATMDGRVETVVKVPGQPSGLGWLPDGRLLVVSMTDRRLMRLDPEGLTEVADLSKLATFHCNDMVVDAWGRAYIGNFGFDNAARHELVPARLIMVTPEGLVRVVAEDLHFPNGSVITPDGRTLVVAETYGARLTAFTIDADGGLSNRRVWAELPGTSPDGICLDAEGAIWVASPTSREVVRVREGGEVTQRTPTSGQAIACMLGGSDRKTLFVLMSKLKFNAEQSREALAGSISTMAVDVPGAGRP